MIEMNIDFGLLDEVFILSSIISLIGAFMGFLSYSIGRKKTRNKKNIIKISRIIEITACFVNLFLFFEFMSQFPKDANIIAVIAIIIYLIPLMLVLMLHKNKKIINTIYLIIDYILILQLAMYLLFLISIF